MRSREGFPAGFPGGIGGIGEDGQVGKHFLCAYNGQVVPRTAAMTNPEYKEKVFATRLFDFGFAATAWVGTFFFDFGFLVCVW